MSVVAKQPAAERLSQFQTIVEPQSQQLLQRAGVAEGMQVLELGCGEGAMTLWLARQVGPSGVVFALDRSETALATVAARARQAGIDNIVCRQVDLGRAALPSDCVDLVYGRFLLMHLHHSASVLCRLFDVMRPGTLVSLEEPVISAFRSQADRRLWHFCVDLYRRHCALQRIDPDYGASLLRHMGQAGFCLQEDRLAFAPMSIAQARQYMALSMKASGQRYVDSGLIERGALEAHIVDLERSVDEAGSTTHFHAVAQVIARR